ncbi:MAG: MMPL family transporter [Deltaproteobacteria bacterium]|nr:MMPL family transporter [Deltaproteobacteria bacterium]
MQRQTLVEFSVKHPRLVLVIAAALTAAALALFPGMKADTNPKNMLPPDSAVRVWNAEVDGTFGLYEDMLVVGVVNEAGVVNPGTLARIARITEAAARIKGVARSDVAGFTTITNVTASAGTLRVAPLMGRPPETPEELEAFRKDLFGNPLYAGRVISRDGKTTAIYIPLEKGANGKAVADELRGIVRAEGGPEEYYVAGDPVARDTFGSIMFKLMAKFSPIAGAIMFVAVLVMFRSLVLACSMMAVAMISVVWSMGLLIGLGYPVHIMSSMAPVFLMAIATDSIHIFNEFSFRRKEAPDRRTAIIETMHAVARPVKFTALATAAGFGVLVFMSIIPVKVFGVTIAFGTVALRLLSFSFIPAVLMLTRDKKAGPEADAPGRGPGAFLRSLSAIGALRPRATVAAVIVLMAVSAIGVTRIVVNNNMVEWFKKDSDVRRSDAAINSALGGTSLAYIVASSDKEEYMKTPEAMRYIEGLQRRLETLEAVGKTNSVVDYVKRINLVLHDNDPHFDAVPGSKEEIGQYLFLFGMSAKPSDLDNVIDPSFTKANVWVQLKTWDVRAMREVMKTTEVYMAANPGAIVLKPAGTAYFNLVWNDEVLWDMLKGFIIALVAVFVILTFNFRSIGWAALGYAPLLFTILLIYGAVGYAGKDFDMPISVLSCLSLGMAVDFSIHYIARFKERLASMEGGGDVVAALLWTAERPGRGIARNAILFGAAFSVMLFAPLTPYVTVGAFIVAMMTLSALFTMVLLPALIVLFGKRLVKGNIRLS